MQYMQRNVAFHIFCTWFGNKIKLLFRTNYIGKYYYAILQKKKIKHQKE